MAACVLLAFTPVAAASEAERFDQGGISFEYPRGWFVTTQPLSAASDPSYRFAVSTDRVKRTRRDVGPCLPGIARQLPRDAALLFLREYVGASRASALPRLGPLPRLRLRRDVRPCGFRDGRGAWINFRAARRALLLAVWLGPQSTKATERAVRRLVGDIEIRAR